MCEKKVFKDCTDGFNGGGYPIMHVLAGQIYCAKCANALDEEEKANVASDVYWEGSPIECSGECGTFIESAYGEPREE